MEVDYPIDTRAESSKREGLVLSRCAECFRPRSLSSRILALSHRDRKSTRLNSSHLVISYAVFCLKKKRQALKAASLSSPSTQRLRVGGALIVNALLVPVNNVMQSQLVQLMTTCALDGLLHRLCDT